MADGCALTLERSALDFPWEHAGIVSDTDIESEKYRWMGGLRLTVQVRCALGQADGGMTCMIYQGWPCVAFMGEEALRGPSWDSTPTGHGPVGWLGYGTLRGEIHQGGQARKRRNLGGDVRRGLGVWCWGLATEGSEE